MLDGGRLFDRDRGRVVHLLQRVASTIRDHHRRYTELHDDISRMRSRQEDETDPMNRANAAIAALNPDQQRQLLDINYLAALDRLEVERQATERARLLAANDLNRVKLLVSTLASDSSIDPTVRTRLEELAGQLAALRIGNPAGE